MQSQANYFNIDKRVVLLVLIAYLAVVNSYK